MAASHLTLKDIAREAGVSVATLDRVLHGRAGVREDTARRVRETIDRHGFRPSSAAADLARRRSSRFAFVMPEEGNVFMQAIVGAVGEMTGWLDARRASVETINVDVFNPVALADALESLVGRYDGVAVVALDHQSVRAAIDDLVAGGTHVVTLVSDVPGSRRHHYVGIDNVAAGRTAGSLVGRFVRGRSGKGRRRRRIPVAARPRRAHLRLQSGDEPGISAACDVERRSRAAIRMRRNEALTAKLLADHPDLIGLYNVGAGTPGVVRRSPMRAARRMSSSSPMI